MTTGSEWLDLTAYFDNYEESCAGNPLPPIERIASVGARIGNHGLFLRDREILRHTIAYLLQSGIPVSRDFSFIPVNIEYNTDFLETPPAADLVVFSYIYGPSRLNWASRRFRADLLSSTKDPDFYNLSPRHFVLGAWNKAALTSGAKIVVSFGLPGSELTIGKLSKRGWFHAVNPGELWIHKKEMQSSEEMGKNGVFSLSIPARTLFAFAVRKEGGYLRDLARYVSPDTFLGERIRHKSARPENFFGALFNTFSLG